MNAEQCLMQRNIFASAHLLVLLPHVRGGVIGKLSHRDPRSHRATWYPAVEPALLGTVFALFVCPEGAFCREKLPADLALLRLAVHSFAMRVKLRTRVKPSIAATNWAAERLLPSVHLPDVDAARRSVVEDFVATLILAAQQPRLARQAPSATRRNIRATIEERG